MTLRRKALEFCGRHVNHVASFAVGQSLSQALTFAITFALMRWLSIEDYAIYGLFASVMQMTSTITNMGASSAIMPIGGQKGLAGTSAAITSVLRFRFLLTTIAAPVAIAYLTYVSTKQGFPLLPLLMMLGLVVLNLVADALAATYPNAILLHGNVRTIYRIGNASLVIRIALLLLAHLSNALTTTVAVFALCLQTVLTGLLNRKFAFRLGVLNHFDTEVDKRVRSLISKNAAGVIFFSFNAQITMFVIAMFGTTEATAQVYALGRIGLLFGFLSIAYKTLIMPRLAQQSDERFRLLSTVSLVGLGCVCSVIVASAIAIPQWERIILGETYSSLREEAIISVIGGCFVVCAYALSDAATSRGWVYHWSTFLRIALVLSVQACGAFVLDLSTVYGSVLFSLLGSMAIFCAHFVQWFVGIAFRHKANV